MYRVINKNRKNSESELYPSFIVKSFIDKAKLNKSYFIKSSNKGLEIQRGKEMWLYIEQVDFKKPLNLEELN